MSEGARCNPKYDSTLASFMLMGFLLAWIAVHRIVAGSDELGYQLSVLIISAAVIAFSVGSLARDQITEGTAMLLLALSAATDSISALTTGVDNVPLMDILYSLPILAFCLVYAFRGRVLPTVSSALLFAGMVLPQIAPGTAAEVIAPPLILGSGVLLAMAGMVGFHASRGEGLKGVAAGHVREMDGPYERVVITGFFMVALYGLLTTFSDYDATFYVAAIVMSSCTLAIGMYGVFKGIVLEGTFILFYSAGSLMFAVGSMTGTGFPVTDTVVSMVSIVCGAYMLMRRQYLPGAAILVFGALSLPGLLLEPGVAWGAGSVIMSVLLLIYSGSRWVFKESGKVTIPISSADGPMRYPHYSDLGRFATAPTAGTMALAMLCFVAFVNSSPWLMDALGLDPGMTENLEIMCALLVLGFAVITMWARMIAESILFLLMGVMSLILRLADMSSDMPGFIITNLFLISGLGTCAYVFHCRGQRRRRDACAVMCASIAVAAVSGDAHVPAMMAGYLISFLLLGSSTVTKTYRICVAKKSYAPDCFRMHQTAEGYAHSLVSTAGILTFAILSLVLGYYAVGGDSSLYMVKIILATVTMAFGIYALMYGLATEGLMMYAVAMITIITSALHIIHVESPHVLTLIASFVFIPLAYRFLKEGDRLMAVASALLFIMFSMETVSENFRYLEVAVAALKAVSCVAAIAAIVHYETGSDMFGRLVKHHDGEEHHGSGSRAVTASHLTIGLLAAWCGANYILIATGGHVDMDTYHCTRIAICAFAMVIVPDMLSRGMLTEGLMCIIVAMSSMAFSLSEVLFDVGGAVPLELVFALGLTVTTLMFLLKRCWALAFVSGTMGIVYAIPPLTGTGATVPLGILALAAGAMLMAHSLLGAILGERGDRILDRMVSPVKSAPRRDYAILVVTTAGMFTAGLLSIVASMFEMSTAYCVSGLFLASVSSTFGVYALFKGRLGLCLYLLSVCFASASMELSVLIGGAADPILPAIAGCLLLISSLPLMWDGFRCLAVTAVVCGALIAIGSVSGIDWVWMIGMVAYGAVTSAYGVNMWIGGERGSTPVPSFV